MILGLQAVLVLATFVCTLVSFGGKLPVQVPLLILVLIELLRLYPK